jgi:hypothetical protein
LPTRRRTSGRHNAEWRDGGDPDTDHESVRTLIATMVQSIPTIRKHAPSVTIAADTPHYSKSERNGPSASNDLT